MQQQSAEEWSFHHQPETVGNITFDTSSMTPLLLCVPQGMWSATSLHGQATLQQHLLPWKGKRLKPTAQDMMVDSAQLAVLLRRGASLAKVAEACDRQPQATTGSGLAKLLSLGLGVATGATTWWGCTTLTWVPHFPWYVSPNPEDAALGALTTLQAMLFVDTDTIICLDAFTVKVQL